jgi:hypothetical protein
MAANKPPLRGRPPKDATMDTLAVRLPADLIAEIDVYMAKIKDVWPLLNVSRADAIRQLIAAGLEAEKKRMGRRGG